MRSGAGRGHSVSYTHLVLEGIAVLVNMVERDEPAIQNAYRRGVDTKGNAVARALVNQVFEPCDAIWRGLGPIPQSGLRIRDDFEMCIRDRPCA